jgi:hypothetical protein
VLVEVVVVVAVSVEAPLLGSWEEVFAAFVVVFDGGGASWKRRRAVVLSCRGYCRDGRESVAARGEIREDVIEEAYRGLGLEDARSS